MVDKGLEAIRSLKFEDFLKHELQWKFNEFKIDDLLDLKTAQYSNVVNGLILFNHLICNGYISDDLQMERAKDVYLDNLVHNRQSERIARILLDGLSIEHMLTFKRSDVRYIKDTIPAHIRRLSTLVKSYYAKFASPSIIRNLYDPDIHKVYISSFIRNSKEADFFGIEADLYSSPFFKLSYSLRLNDIRDTVESYIPIQLLVFPMLSKMCTIMLDYNSNHNDPIKLYFITCKYTDHNIKEVLEKVLHKTAYLHISLHPNSRTDMIADFYPEYEKLSFGNIINNKIVGYIFNLGLSSRHLLVQSKGNFWLDQISMLSNFSGCGQFFKSESFKKVQNYIDKVHFDVTKQCPSWIDLFKGDINKPVHIRSLFEAINQQLGSYYRINDLVEFVFEDSDRF